LRYIIASAKCTALNDYKEFRARAMDADIDARKLGVRPTTQADGAEDDARI
jgi:hypothetical protein